MNVVFIIYKRPDLTARVFAEIARAKPSKLFIIADGPKSGDSGEGKDVELARKVVEKIEWPCEIFRNYSDVNLGCRKRVSSGLDWVFSQVEEAIIIEDDCLPDPSFFPFCCELLELYRNDKRIMHISGNNFQNGIRRSEYSYYFSKYVHVWGWATWRRAWKQYDSAMKSWPLFRESQMFKNLCAGERQNNYWRNILNDTYNGLVDTWDYVWLSSVWFEGGIAIIPGNNLVENIGVGLGATHTACLDGMRVPEKKSISFPLRHPLVVACDIAGDEYTECYYFSGDIKKSDMFVEKLVSVAKRFRDRVTGALSWRTTLLLNKVCFLVSLVLGRIKGLPGIDFALFGLSCARKLRKAGLNETAWSMAVTPVSSIRYFEFPFTDRFLPHIGGGRYLDVSSPMLWGAWWLSKYTDIAIDFVNPDNRDLAETAGLLKTLGYENRIRLHEKNAAKLEWPDNTFDGGWMISVIEHIKEPDDALALCEIQRVLKKGARFILTTIVSPVYLEEFRDFCTYQIRGIQPEVNGSYFFQRRYDALKLQTGIFKVLKDMVLLDAEIWTEKKEGLYDEYVQDWLRFGAMATCRDPYLMAEYFEKCKFSELKGFGVGCYVFEKK